jgi:hypothetical protein
VEAVRCREQGDLQASGIPKGRRGEQDGPQNSVQTEAIAFGAGAATATAVDEASRRTTMNRAASHKPGAPLVKFRIADGANMPHG